MELNERKQVIKALECCKIGCCYIGACPFAGDGGDDDISQCTSELAKNALALINELTQAHEMLRESYDHLEKTKDELLAERSRLTEENERLRKYEIAYETPSGKQTMPNLLSLEGDAARLYTQIEYKVKADTVRKMHQAIKDCAFNPNNKFDFIYDEIDRIAEEMVEGDLHTKAEK